MLKLTQIVITVRASDLLSDDDCEKLLDKIEPEVEKLESNLVAQISAIDSRLIVTKD